MARTFRTRFFQASTSRILLRRKAVATMFWLPIALDSRRAFQPRSLFPPLRSPSQTIAPLRQPLPLPREPAPAAILGRLARGTKFFMPARRADTLFGSRGFRPAPALPAGALGAATSIL